MGGSLFSGQLPKLGFIFEEKWHHFTKYTIESTIQLRYSTLLDATRRYLTLLDATRRYKTLLVGKSVNMYQVEYSII
jgi:hypothetical protein